MERTKRFVGAVGRLRYSVISFITGFALLTYELAAARILAPSIGSSTYIWTSVIGTIIAALSFGFFVGGKVADKRASAPDVAYLLLAAALTAVFTLGMYPAVLELSVESFDDDRLQALTAALLLFAPTSFFIGMTSPYLAKLNVRSLRSTGQTIANLDMMNALGGILGTFVTGFVLFGFVGSKVTILLVVVLLLLASWIVAPKVRTVGRSIVTVTILLVAASAVPPAADAVSIDTPSANYTVASGFYEDMPVIGLVTGPGGIQSAVSQDSNELVFWYTRELARLAEERQPERILVLGGGAFTLPQYLAEQLPDSRIDVVEIDPELKEISERYFRYENPKNVELIFSDARTFVNRTDRTYDMVIVDVYGDASIPFTLITKEYGRAVAERVRPEGIVAVNLIAGTEGPCRKVFEAVDAAYRSGLRYGAYVMNPTGDPSRANNVVVYSKVPLGLDGYQTPPRGQIVYSDDFSPAERLYHECQSRE